MLAALIVKRATTLVNQKLKVYDSKLIPYPKDTVESAASRHRLADTPVSCTLTFTLEGADMMLTLHDASESALFPRIRHLLAWVKGLNTCMSEEDSNENKLGGRSEKLNSNPPVP